MSSVDAKTRRRRADAGRRWPLSRIVNVAVLALLAKTVVLGTGKCVEDFDTLRQVLVPERRR